MSFALPNQDQWYEKDPKLNRQSVKSLLQWAQTQPHLPQLHEMHAIWFLHSCYYDPEHAKRTIDNFFTGKTKLAPILDSAPEEVVNKILSSVCLSPMPEKTKDGCVVILFKLIDARPEVFDYLGQIKVFNMLLQLHLKDEGCPEGVVCVYDCTNYTFGHILRTPMGVASKLTSYVEGALPVRIKGIHFVNLNPFAHKLLKIMRSFIGKQIYEMMKLHSNLEELYHFIPTNCLPVELGGSLPSYLDIQEKQRRKLLENMEYFRYQDALKVDENKRIKDEKRYFGSLWSRLGF